MTNIIDFSVNEVIISSVIADMLFGVIVDKKGQYDGIDFLYYKGNGRWYAPIIEEKGEYYTEEEYHSSSVME